MKKKSESEIKIHEDIIRTIKGLDYISEIDSSFDFFDLEADQNNPKKALMSLKDDKNLLKEESPKYFFLRLTTEKEWHGEIEKKNVKKYRRLEKIFTEQLEDAKIFISGKVNKQIFIVGRTSKGNWLGVRTRSLET